MNIENRSEQAKKAQNFRELHQGNGRILVLPNAWDAASARIFEEAGFPAVGTTSAGIAFSLGYPDGEMVSRDEMLQAIKRITQAVQVPVTADIEAGYGGDSSDIGDILDTVSRVLVVGAVGINLEDGVAGQPSVLSDVALQVERIRAIRDLASANGIPLVINARTDAFRLAHLDAKERFKVAVDRLNAYRSAGADCLFAPYLTDATIIGELVRAVHGPINILALAGSPSVEELARLGVVRVSVGGGPYRALMALLRDITAELSDSGTYKNFTQHTISYEDMNALMRR